MVNDTAHFILGKLFVNSNGKLIESKNRLMVRFHRTDWPFLKWNRSELMSVLQKENKLKRKLLKEQLIYQMYYPN